MDKKLYFQSDLKKSTFSSNFDVIGYTGKKRNVDILRYIGKTQLFQNDLKIT